MRQEQQATPDIRVFRYGEADIPTEWGTFHVTVYRTDADDLEHLVVARSRVVGATDLLARVHSECFTGEVLGSLRCDCREQLVEAFERIAAARAGALVYLRQEGRGIGLGNKIRAYALQDRGADTVDANHRLGFPSDLRRYDIAAKMLADQGVRSVVLLTNNPAKVEGLERGGVSVTRREPLVASANPHNARYLETKRWRMGHLLDPLLG